MISLSGKSEAPQRPVLTFGEVESARVRAHYEAASVILEYGSGGSTVLAAEMDDTVVFSVESDRKWAASMEAWFEANPPKGDVRICPVNIGQTVKWGLPKDTSGFRRYHQYPIDVWDRDDFQHPDLVLIDGRFRAACLITTMLRIERPVTVLFDDYVERPRYHIVERYAKPAELHGRMARFELEPRAFPVKDMAQIFRIFTRPM